MVVSSAQSEAGDDGSDSNPSEDNLDPKEIVSILPAEVQLEAMASPATVQQDDEEEKKAKKSSAVATRKTALRASVRPSLPGKEPLRLFHRRVDVPPRQNNARRDRRQFLKGGNNLIQYIEMVDSWTQTSFHEESYPPIKKTR